MLAAALVVGVSAIVTTTASGRAAATKSSAPTIAADGTSVLSPAGIDRAVRDGRITISLGPTRRPADELGLHRSQVTRLDFALPVTLTVLSSADALVWRNVTDVEVTTRNGRIDAVGVALPEGDEGARIGELTAEFGWPADTREVVDAEIAQAERRPFLFTRAHGLLRVGGLWANLLARGGGGEATVVRLVLEADQSRDI